MIRAKLREIISRALDEGTSAGLARWARKGNAPESVTDAHLASAEEYVVNALWVALDEVVTFDEPAP